MSATETSAAVLATTAGLAAIVVDYVSVDAGGDPLVAGIAGAVTVGVAVLLFAGVLPRARARQTAARRTAQTALVTSGIGFLSVASAWTGLPFVLGTGGAMLASTARREAGQSGQRNLAAFATALGVSAVALGLVAVVWL